MPLLTPRSDVGLLTSRYRASQARRASVVAALVAAYYRSRVKFNDPRSVDRWLEVMVPKVMDEVDKQADAAIRYGQRVRQAEIGYDDGYRWDRSEGAVIEQVVRSLRVVGPSSHTSKFELIEDKVAGEKPKDRDTMRRALERDAVKAVETQIMGSMMRHMQNGSRQTLIDNAVADPVALGWVRVTRDKPCYFCVMLASRGPKYGEDSFDESDPRFVGEGNVKVHDSCQCTFKPVYTPQTDDYVMRSDYWEAMWREFSTGSSGEAIRTFRNKYNAWLKDPALFVG